MDLYELDRLKGEKSDEELSPQDYMLLHNRCAICHWPDNKPGRTLQLHHIVGGAGRKNCEENYTAVCSRCHTAIHDRLPEYGEIPKGAVLAAKLEEDGYLDLDKLASLTGRRALAYDVCPIPEKFIEDRTKNTPAWPY
jgi:hypothetical protein